MSHAKPTIVLITDESGAKGYASTSERSPGEFGVVAGLLLPDHRVDEVRTWAGSLAAQLSPVGEKLHIADLPPHQQAGLRKAVFAYVTERCIPCVYEAIYVEGLYESFRKERVWLDEAKRAAATRGLALPVRVEPESLHAKLLLGAFETTLSFAARQYRTRDFHVEVRIDNVDQALVSKFNDEVRPLLGPMSGTRPIPIYNLATQQRQDGSMSVEVPNEAELLGQHDVSYAVNIDTTPLTLLADVIANSVHYSLRPVAARAAPLMDPDALTQHALSSRFYRPPPLLGLAFADAVYMHPAERDGRGR